MITLKKTMFIASLIAFCIFLLLKIISIMGISYLQNEKSNIDFNSIHNYINNEDEMFLKYKSDTQKIKKFSNDVIKLRIYLETLNGQDPNNEQQRIINFLNQNRLWFINLNNQERTSLAINMVFEIDLYKKLFFIFITIPMLLSLMSTIYFYQ